MSDQFRVFPDRPSLRYLKIEARRRLAAGEFTHLHDAQLAIAREHGLPSWAALKQHIASQPGSEGADEAGGAAGPEGTEGHALEQLRWVVARFGQPGQPGLTAWQPPGDGELREHFTERFLTRLPAPELAVSLSKWAGGFREGLTVTLDQPLVTRVEGDGLQVVARAEPEPPHRLDALGAFRMGDRVHDARVAVPSTRTSGEVPARAAEAAETEFAGLGLPGLVLARDGVKGGAWALARGWADLEQGEVLRTDHRFPVGAITTLITATAVLRLAGDGRLGLDDPANGHLRTVRLADGAITVRDLLAHTAGMAAAPPAFAGAAADLVSFTGPVLACDGTRGTFARSAVGYAALGQMIADLTGEAYPDAATRLVLAPLGMTGSSFPASPPGPGSAPVTGYRLDEDNQFVPVPAQVATFPAAGGLWTTAADLLRFGLGWRSLLPAELVREALRPQADTGNGVTRAGLGWVVNESLGAAGHGAARPGASASLVTRIGGGGAYAALTNRHILIEPVIGRVARAVGDATSPT